MTLATIHVYLLDEGVDVWRPVLAQHLRDDLYRIVVSPPDGEVWEFNHGDVVRCRRQSMSGDGGKIADTLVAFEKSN